MNTILIIGLAVLVVGAFFVGHRIGKMAGSRTVGPRPPKPPGERTVGPRPPKPPGGGD